MPRYIVERTFLEGFPIATDPCGAADCRAAAESNRDLGVTWIQSFVTVDRTKTYCVYEAPTPEAIRKSARRQGLPVDRIAQVMVLDPYFYLSADVMTDQLIQKETRK